MITAEEANKIATFAYQENLKNEMDQIIESLQIDIFNRAKQGKFFTIVNFSKNSDFSDKVQHCYISNYLTSLGYKISSYDPKVSYDVVRWE